MRTKAYKSRKRHKSSSPFFPSHESQGFFGVQPKLTMGKPNDKYEQEADKIADSVVRNAQNKTNGISPENGMPLQTKHGELIQEKPLAESITPLVQKKEEVRVKAEAEEEELQAKAKAEEEEEMVQGQIEEEEEVQAQAEEEEEPVQMQTDDEEEEVPLKGEIQAKEDDEEEEVPIKGEAKAQAEEEEEIQAKGQGGLKGQAVASPSVESRLKRNGSNGSKMDKNTRAEMERSFGTDFSRVNIHTDNEAVQLNKEMGAQAFTHGNDVYFNEGKYKPGSNDGKHLLAHELTHTIQQTGRISNSLQFTIGDGNDLRAARFSGNLILEACLDNEQTLRQGSSGAAVTLIQQALVDAGFALPRFGVDGIFGNETRAALQDFQRSSSLQADGIVGPGTMSALDALFAGGAPALPPVNPVVPGPGTPPTITSETIKPAPDGGPDTRTTVGVGERVRFTANTAGTWTASEGHFIGRNNGANIVWEAPATASSPTITLTTTGGARVLPLTVIAPNAITMTVLRRHAILAGTSGACMINDVVINPLNVNFGRTQWLEVPGPATNVTGYFTQFAADTIFHEPTDHYLGVADDNSGLEDHAAWHEVPAPFSFGTFEWVIPNRYKIDGEPDAQGRVFTNTVQAFFMFAGGTMMINKAGASVIRFINNTVI